MRFKLEVNVAELKPVILNQPAVIREMARIILDRVRARTERGESATGAALPKPKDGGQPLRRTGSFLDSFGIRERTYPDGTISAVVRPMGPRPQEEHAGIKRKRLAVRSRRLALMAAGAIGVALQKVAGTHAQAPPLASIRRRRTVVDQGSLAAILSLGPRDERGQKGDRGVYLVFVPKETERADARRAAQELIQLELQQTGRIHTIRRR